MLPGGKDGPNHPVERFVYSFVANETQKFCMELLNQSELICKRRGARSLTHDTISSSSMSVRVCWSAVPLFFFSVSLCSLYLCVFFEEAAEL